MKILSDSSSKVKIMKEKIRLISILSMFTQIYCRMVEPIVLVHGGAGDIPDSRVTPKINGVKKAAAIGYKVLQKGGSAADAVEEAVKYMEDDEAFNAGYGSVLNQNGEVEMDASIMIGANLNAGGVAAVKNVAHPITLARLVMEKTSHILLAGYGAEQFAKVQNVTILEPGSLVSKSALAALDTLKHNSTETGDVGTVGAVAIDAKGRLAAATSTGGTNGKLAGRVGDSPVIGSGTYADDALGAVSCTGHGESIAKVNLAHSILNEIKNGKNASEATAKSVREMTQRLKNTAGAITLSKSGQIGIGFSSDRMAWAYQVKDEIHYGVEHDQHVKEKVV